MKRRVTVDTTLNLNTVIIDEEASAHFAVLLADYMARNGKKAA